MNLGEILDAIGVELQHSPSSSTVRLERARIVAQEYLSLLGERRWTWTQQLADLAFYPKVTWSGSLTFAFRKLTFPSSVVGSWWVGHTVTITVGGTSFDGVVEATESIVEPEAPVFQGLGCVLQNSHGGASTVGAALNIITRQKSCLACSPAQHMASPLNVAVVP